MARDFSAAHPNEKWVTDVTEFKVAKQKLFLSPVMDLFNREIITWTVNTSPTYSLVQTMLRQALTQLPEGKKVILHSDQGLSIRVIGVHPAAAGGGTVGVDRQHRRLLR